MIRLTLILVAVSIGGCAARPQKAGPDPRDVQKVADDARIRQEAMDRSDQLTAEGEALMARDLDLAIEKYREAIRAWPTAPIAYNNLGYALLKRAETGDLREAHDALLIAAEQNPTDPRPLRNLGVLYIEVGRNQEAFEVFSEALERNPNDLGSLLGIVQAGHVLQRADEQMLEYVERAQLYLAGSPDWGPYLARRRIATKQQIESEQR